MSVRFGDNSITLSVIATSLCLKAIQQKDRQLPFLFRAWFAHVAVRVCGCQRGAVVPMMPEIYVLNVLVDLSSGCQRK
jgi:hypothetical protein